MSKVFEWRPGVGSLILFANAVKFYVCLRIRALHVLNNLRAALSMILR